MLYTAKERSVNLIACQRKMRYRRLLLLTIPLLMTISGHTQQLDTVKPASAPPADERWVSQTLEKMSLREKLGQLLMVTVAGQFTPVESLEYKELVREVVENHVGGFILITQRGGLGIIRAEVYPTAVIVNQLQELATVPLLIGADFERGTGMRLDEGTSFPFAMAVAAADDPRDAYTVGKVTALEARAAGLQWIFAPDADMQRQSRQSDHQYALIWRRPAASSGIRETVRPRRGRKWRLGDRKTFSRAWRCNHRFASGSADGAGKPAAAGNRGAGAVPLRH